MNQELKNQIVEFIKENPDNFNMDDFVSYNFDTDEYEFCIAGIAILLSQVDDSPEKLSTMLEDGDCEEISAYASKLLDCNSNLFYYCSWPNHLYNEYNEYNNANNSEYRALVALKAIEYYS